jgi:hypothetical protein
MVARPGTYQASNNAGELAPQEYGRTDIKQFGAGLATALNIEPVPQGGSQLSMRTRHLARARRLLLTQPVSGSALPAGSYTVAGTLAQISLTAISAVCRVLLPAWSASQPLGAILQVEYLVAGTWFPFGSAFGIGVDAADITVALPPGQSATSADFRLSMVSPPLSATSFTGGALQAASETAVVAEARIRPFTFSLTQTYVAVLMDNHADFYRDGVWVGASVTGVLAAQLDVIDWVQRLDTALLFHAGAVSSRILRNGSDSSWLRSDIPFENIPQVDLGGNYSNQVTDVWGLYVRFPIDGPSNPHFNGRSLLISINVNGEDVVVPTPGTDPDWAAIATAIAAAIEGTTAAGPGIAVAANSSPSGSQGFTITFSGAQNLGAVFSLSAQVVNALDAAATVTHLQVGKPGGEALISTGRGHAGCGGFYQDRLVTGGFLSKRSAFLASVTGEYFDINVKIVGPNGAILANIDTDGAEQLQRIVRDKYLLLFTSDAEYFIADRTLDRTKPPTIANSSRYGSAADLPVLANESEVLWASRNKSVLYAAHFDEVAASYVPEPISLLAPHIVNAMTDMALQRPAGVGNAARLWMARADGSVTLGILLRGQQVQAFVRWQTPGPVRSVCVDGKNVPHMLVERSVGGLPELHLERAEDPRLSGLIFDDTVEQNFEPAQTVIGGLAMHDGAEVWAAADGYVLGPFTVAAGAITLDAPAHNVKVGRWTPPRAVPLPLPSEIKEGIVLKRPKRVHTVRIDLVETTSIAIGANGLAARDQALARAGDPIDAPQAAVSRELVATGLKGFAPYGQIEITQVRPGQLAWSGFTREART